MNENKQSTIGRPAPSYWLSMDDTEYLYTTHEHYLSLQVAAEEMVALGASRKHILFWADTLRGIAEFLEAEASSQAPLSHRATHPAPSTPNSAKTQPHAPTGAPIAGGEA